MFQNLSNVKLHFHSTMFSNNDQIKNMKQKVTLNDKKQNKLRFYHYLKTSINFYDLRYI